MKAFERVRAQKLSKKSNSVRPTSISLRDVKICSDNKNENDDISSYKKIIRVYD